MGISLEDAARKMAEDEVLNATPIFQEDCARIAARTAIHLLGVPSSSAAFQILSHKLAAGLFGDGFAKADVKQRALWDQMCERALREEAAIHDRPLSA